MSCERMTSGEKTMNPISNKISLLLSALFLVSCFGLMACDQGAKTDAPKAGDIKDAAKKKGGEMKKEAAKKGDAMKKDAAKKIDAMKKPSSAPGSAPGK